ncbi:MAG: HNH endonuclease, partial [Mycoplasma sp.]|nr:HNH endonuclease [Mycoplasma sp.]
KILIDWTKISIEHIAPQNPKNNTWKELLEAENDKDYEEKVNLLGNLTIVTKDANNNLSNGDWQEKRQKLSHFKHIKINESLLKKDIFNYEVIQQRSKELVKDFLNIFKS